MRSRSCLVPLVLVVVLICCSSACALLCYTVDPSSDSDSGKNSVILVDHIGDTGMCVRYLGGCKKADHNCKPADVGKFAWMYAASDIEVCALMMAAASRPYYHHVMCCTTDRCNAPDPKVDKVTKVLPGVIKAGKAPLP